VAGPIGARHPCTAPFALTGHKGPGPERLVIMTVRSTPPLVKAETAADYVSGMPATR